MKSLYDYLTEAVHCFYPEATETVEKERELAINYCRSRNLDGEFQKAILQLPSWIELARSTGVQFYIEEPLKQRPGSLHNCAIQTGVFAHIYDSGTIAVIKIVM